MILGNTANPKNLLYYYQTVWQIFLFDKRREESDMLSSLFQNNIQPTEVTHKEGELYKVVTTFGKTFELRYGYYQECDRQSPLCDPVVIYPDFTKEPVYTDEGPPFVTVMQNACESYRGDTKRTPDTTCDECKFFRRGEEWFGICTCPRNKKL